MKSYDVNDDVLRIVNMSLLYLHRTNCFECKWDWNIFLSVAAIHSSISIDVNAFQVVVLFEAHYQSPDNEAGQFEPSFLNDSIQLQQRHVEIDDDQQKLLDIEQNISNLEKSFSNGEHREHLPINRLCKSNFFVLFSLLFFIKIQSDRVSSHHQQQQHPRRSRRRDLFNRVLSSSTSHQQQSGVGCESESQSHAKADAKSILVDYYYHVLRLSSGVFVSLLLCVSRTQYTAYVVRVIQFPHHLFVSSLFRHVYRNVVPVSGIVAKLTWNRQKRTNSLYYSREYYNSVLCFWLLHLMGSDLPISFPSCVCVRTRTLCRKHVNTHTWCARYPFFSIIVRHILRAFRRNISSQTFGECKRTGNICTWAHCRRERVLVAADDAENFFPSQIHSLT